jgi:hypothetical protein
MTVGRLRSGGMAGSESEKESETASEGGLVVV